ncbi:MAG: ribonuclease P protein component [Desulfobulbaceae bacterium]|nr:ribonuclease P protein component [Desulfobulbaceae bacterium]
MFELPKSALLRKPWEFELVYRRGKRVRGKGFAIIFLPNENNSNRLGISVHRKLRGVVQRNRIKRIFRESFRLHRDIFPPASDIVVTVRPDFALRNLRQVSAEMERLFLTPDRMEPRDV